MSDLFNHPTRDERLRSELETTWSEWTALNEKMAAGESVDTHHYNELMYRAKAHAAELSAIESDGHLRHQLVAFGGSVGLTAEHAPYGRSSPSSMTKALPPFTSFGRGAWGAEFANWRSKQLVAPGQQLPVALPQPPIVEIGRPVQNMRSLLPHTPASGGIAQYWGHVTRENRAAVVTFPNVKPESDYGGEMQTVAVATVAHVSKPQSRFMLADAPRLGQFLDGEMRYGVEEAIERMLISGEADPVIEGFLTAGGTIAQAPTDDPLVTLRLGIGEVEDQGYPVTGIVMSSADWTAAEVQKDQMGRFMLDASPADRAARRLWGVPVVTTKGMPAGKALLGDFAGSAALAVADNGQVNVSYSESVGDSFVRNAIVWRAEARLALMLMRPAAFCVVALAEGSNGNGNGNGENNDD